jgi:hypothetical protein
MTTDYITFIVAFSKMTGRTTIHADWCQSGKHLNGSNRAIYTWEIEAADAEQAAAIVAEQEELSARGMRLPAICKCARHHA